MGNDGFSSYTIGGASNPTIKLQRGVTYTFDVMASGHPFYIQTSNGAYAKGSVYSTGITNNGLAKGKITFTPSADAPNVLYYVCEYHPGMQGVIEIEPVATAKEEDHGHHHVPSPADTAPTKGDDHDHHHVPSPADTTPTDTKLDVNQKKDTAGDGVNPKASIAYFAGVSSLVLTVSFFYLPAY